MAHWADRSPQASRYLDVEWLPPSRGHFTQLSSSRPVTPLRPSRVLCTDNSQSARGNYPSAPILFGRPASLPRSMWHGHARCENTTRENTWTTREEAPVNTIWICLYVNLNESVSLAQRHMHNIDPAQAHPPMLHSKHFTQLHVVVGRRQGFRCEGFRFGRVVTPSLLPANLEPETCLGFGFAPPLPNLKNQKNYQTNT